MFKKNSTEKEVFAIFLWLIGIILFYTIVYTFLLEPSSDNTHSANHGEVASLPAIHEVKQKESIATVVSSHTTKDMPSIHAVKSSNTAAVTSKTSSEGVTDSGLTAVKHEIPQKESTETIEKEKISQLVLKTVEKDDTPVIKIKDVVKTVTSTQTLMKETTPVDTLKISTDKIHEPKTNATKITTLPLSKMPLVPKVPTVSKPIEVTKTADQKAMDIKKIETPVEIQPIIEKKVAEKEVPEEKKYDRDATMKLLETARQHVIEKAESARTEIMKSLGR